MVPRPVCGGHYIHAGGASIQVAFKTGYAALIIIPMLVYKAYGKVPPATVCM